jgi:hypothetical protein
VYEWVELDKDRGKACDCWGRRRPCEEDRLCVALDEWNEESEWMCEGSYWADAPLEKEVLKV